MPGLVAPSATVAQEQLALKAGNLKAGMEAMPTVSHTVKVTGLEDDWRADLHRDGFAIIRNAITSEAAEGYRQRLFQWIENWKLGFDRKDKSTWVPDKIPVTRKGGMFHHSIGQEAVLWDLRQEEGIIEPFTKLWGTDELLVSFDGANVSLPGAMQDPNQAPWYHIDQDTHRRGFLCAQGLINLNENGPDDGGLILLKGSHKLNDEYFTKAWDGKDGVLLTGAEAQPDFFGFTPSVCDWFTERGCEWVKTELHAGDLVIWDSRVAHYNVPPRGDRDRVAAYMCYAPAAHTVPEQLAEKQAIFKASKMTSHWPNQNLAAKTPIVLRNGVQCKNVQDVPFEKAVHTDKLLKLAGVLPY